MLAVKRKAGQSIRIGDDIEVHIVKVDRGDVELGVKAPKHLPIEREQKEEPNDRRSHPRR